MKVRKKVGTSADVPTSTEREASVATFGTQVDDARGLSELDTPETAAARRLGDVLIQRGLVTAEQLSEAVAQQPGSGLRLGELLVDMGVLGERGLVEALAEQFDMSITDLRSENPSAEALALVPEAFAREHSVLPISLNGNFIQVAVADLSGDLDRQLANITKHEVVMMLAPLSEVRRSIDSSYRALSGVDQLVRAFEAVQGSRKVSANLTEPEVVSDDAPVVQVVNRILTQALRDRASDIHIEPQDETVRVRFRIDGALKEVLMLPAAMGLGLVSRIKVMAGMNIVERRRPQDGQLSTDIDGRSVDVRVSTLATIWGEKCVMRMLDTTRSVLGLRDLGMPENTADAYSKLVRSPFGMVICAGPTGSGKTTTLYATLTEVNDPTRNIMSIEDPVEYVFPEINQIQTHEQAGLTFATGLRSILRQDPDVILVGEIRDVETARIAVQSALTGHFVLSSLHATDSVSALHRFLDMGIESFLIASSVLGIIGQRLVRKICPSCKTRYTPSDEEMAFYTESGGTWKGDFWHGEGCNFCSGTGYMGRIGVYEFLQISSDVKRLVVEHATPEVIRDVARSQGMRTLRDEAIRLVAQDETTIAEVVRSIYTL